MRRKTARYAALIAASLVAGAGNADAAAPLSTGHLLADNTQYVRCVISNLSAKEVVVDKIEAVDTLGNVTPLRTPFTLAPGVTEPNVFFFTPGRCVFTLKKRKLVRAYGCVSNLGASLCLTESEAR